MRSVDEDDELRAAAFAFLADLVARTGGLVRRQDLRGFSFKGQNVVEVRSDVLREHDGPTLQHALQEMDGTSLWVPPRTTAQPSKDLLEERFERFRAAG